MALPTAFWTNALDTIAKAFVSATTKRTSTGGSTLKCPRCGAWTDLLETRTRANGEKARRYECGNEHRFTVLGDICTVPTHKSTIKLGTPGSIRDRFPKSLED